MPFFSPFGHCEESSRLLHEILLERIDQETEEKPQNKAFISADDEDDFVTFSQIRAQSESVAQFLNDNHLSKATVATLMFSDWRMVSLLIGASMEGCTLSPISPVFTQDEVQRQLVESDATVLVVDQENLERALQLSEIVDWKIKMIIVCSRAEKDVPSAMNLKSWNEVIRTIPNSSRQHVAISPDDVVLLPFSSGTTGLSKAVMLSHRNMSSMLAMHMKYRRHMLGLSEESQALEETMIISFPLYHVSGMCASCISTVDGSSSILMSRFEIATFLDIIQKHKITQVSASRATLVFLSKDKVTEHYDLTSLSNIFSGAAPLGREIFEKVLRKFPHIQFISQGYGTTELTLISHLPDISTFGKLGSVGKLMPGLQAKIVHPVTGEELPAGEEGELCIKGPIVMLGYKNNRKATEECIRDGWLHTGDIAKVDADGDTYIMDRLKDMIKVNGLQVVPAELECQLVTHPGILDAAVIGVPHETLGEVPKAFIVRAYETLTEQDIHDYMNDKVAPYRQLQGGIVFIQKVPRNSTGKGLRRELRKWN